MDFRKYTVLATLFLLLLASACKQEYEIFDDLTVSSHTLNVEQTPGETHVVVYSTGSWKVAFDKAVAWASLNKLSGEGLADFVVSWSANYGIARSVDIIVSRGQREERITLIQASAVSAPYISFGSDKVVLPKQTATLSIPFTTNLGLSISDFHGRALCSGGDNSWISDFKILPDSFEFTVAANESGSDRSASVECYTVDAAGAETRASLSLVQTVSGPEFVLTSGSGEYYANAQTCVVPAEKNNIWSLEGVALSSDAAWVRDLAIVEEGLVFAVDENTSGSPRSATVSLNFEGLSGTVSYQFTQEGEKMLSFPEVRSMAPGTMHGHVFIEGIIVSDVTSPNVCSSPQTGQFSFDRSENGRTAYIESVDGTYGFCLKFADSADNTMPRWSKVHISLEGLELSRETSPLRFTLKGLTATNVTVVEERTAVPEKFRKIGQLLDTDIYTYVSLQSVEIMCKDGCFTNASEGYSLLDDCNPSGNALPRWDVAPLLCSDSSGDVIYMLTNAAAPWRRTGEDLQWGSCVPQGSGVLGGVIVADDVAPVRWGNLGRYQIRPMNVEEIALNDAPFSSTLCEWNWNDRKADFTQDEGQGTLHTYDAATSFVQDFNNPYMPTDNVSGNGGGETNLKGLVAGGAACLRFDGSWDFETGTGKYFDVSFPTVGVSGTNMIFGIVWGHGLGSSTTLEAPSHWKVLYSVDGGKNFAEVPSAGIIKQRSCAWWSNPQTSQDATPGYTEHLVTLPSTCFGKSSVVIRLQAADTVTDIAPQTGASIWRQALGIEQGTLTETSKAYVRIGTITVRYN